jgi:multiple sugar transport system permease protein
MSSSRPASARQGTGWQITAGRPAASAGRPPPRRPSLEDRPVAWLAPLFLMIGVFYLYPLLATIRLSLTGAHASGTTLANFREVLGSTDFAGMVRITAIFVLGSVAGQLIAGLLIAALLVAGERRRLPGTGLVRGVVMIGWILPGVVLGIIWKLLLDESPSGVLAYLLSFIGVANPVFLSAAGPALFWVTIANIWRGTAFSMLMQYSGMQTIPPELYEAATVDGASPWQQFTRITIPSLRRILLINLVLITIATLNTFDMVVPLTGGGPGRATEVVALFIYDVVFVQFSIGRGAAVAIMLALLGIVLTVAYFRIFFAAEDEQPA